MEEKEPTKPAVAATEYDENEIAQKVLTDGIFIIKGYIDSDKIEIMDKEFEDLLVKNKSKLDKLKNIKCLRTNLNSGTMKNVAPVCNEVFSREFMKNIADKVLGKGKWKYNNIFLHKDFANDKTNNVFPHFDVIRQLKFYICINDMNEENGCFKALPGKLDLVKQKRKENVNKNIFTPGHKQYNGTQFDLEDLTPIIAKAGDLIIFDTNCIHCGGDKFAEGKFRKVMRLHIKKK